MPIWPIWPNFEVNGLDWQYCLAGSSKRAPRILIFSIAMGAEYLSSVKSIATFAPTFYGYIISVLASVMGMALNLFQKQGFKKSNKTHSHILN